MFNPFPRAVKVHQIHGKASRARDFSPLTPARFCGLDAA